MARFTARRASPWAAHSAWVLGERREARRAHGPLWPTAGSTGEPERLPIKLELLPDDGSEGRYGKVRFIDVPPDLLNAERAPLSSPGFFGCTTIECLNEGLQATFEIEENSLRIKRPTSENTWRFAAWIFGDFPAMPE
jgi:hypothetical protein